jgi:sugar phosphate isomerase/epimerase
MPNLGVSDCCFLNNHIFVQLNHVAMMKGFPMKDDRAFSGDISRRSFLGKAAVAGAATAGLTTENARSQSAISSGSSGARKGNPIAVSTYSFWHFDPDDVTPVDHCIELAAEMGFDAVELLEVQMQKTDRSYLQQLKRQAFLAGMDLCGLSTHQGFVTPDADKRQANIERTRRSMELAHELGIPIIRVNTGRWGTSGSFDDLMAARGIESPLEGYTEEDAYQWVIESFEKCLPMAEELGVILGLENHWGLGRTPEGVLRIVESLDSPWFRAIADTGNFLEDPYDRLEKMMPEVVFVQAKTYFGGGVWYSLDLDYSRIGKMLHRHDYRGYVSLEFEGREDPRTAVPKSLAVLREALAYENV